MTFQTKVAGKYTLATTVNIICFNGTKFVSDTAPGDTDELDPSVLDFQDESMYDIIQRQPDRVVEALNKMLAKHGKSLLVGGYSSSGRAVFQLDDDYEDELLKLLGKAV